MSVNRIRMKNGTCIQSTCIERLLLMSELVAARYTSNLKAAPFKHAYLSLTSSFAP
jgi:hypothetical protein